MPERRVATLYLVLVLKEKPHLGTFELGIRAIDSKLEMVINIRCWQLERLQD